MLSAIFHIIATLTVKWHIIGAATTVWDIQQRKVETKVILLVE
jgi:hypothetical protein